MPDVIVSGEDVENGKPHPACYLLGAERLGVRPSDCAVFEEAAAGIRAGEAAGSSLVVITATHRHVQASQHFAAQDYSRLGVDIAEDKYLQLVSLGA